MIERSSKGVLTSEWRKGVSSITQTYEGHF